MDYPTRLPPVPCRSPVRTRALPRSSPSLVGDEVAVGITRLDDDGFGLKVNLSSDPGRDVALPDEIEGVPVQVEVVGRIRKR